MSLLRRRVIEKITLPYHTFINKIYLQLTLELQLFYSVFFFPWRKSHSGPEFYPSFMITLKHTTLGSTPLDE
jgi:hypothetical protein